MKLLPHFKNIIDTSTNPPGRAFVRLATADPLSDDAIQLANELKLPTSGTFIVAQTWASLDQKVLVQPIAFINSLGADAFTGLLRDILDALVLPLRENFVILCINNLNSLLENGWTLDSLREQLNSEYVPPNKQ